MTKRVLIAAIAVFVAWSVLDFVIHGLLLQSTYAATAYLWRRMDQVNRPAMSLVTFAVSEAGSS